MLSQETCALYHFVPLNGIPFSDVRHCAYQDAGIVIGKKGAAIKLIREQVRRQKIKRRCCSCAAAGL